MNRDKAMELVRKCLALSGNNNSFDEAMVAAIKAQKLMVEYNITHQELATEKKRISTSVITEWERTPLWKKALASIVAPNYRCFWYLETRDGVSIIVFVGIEGDTDIAKFMFHNLCDRLQEEWFKLKLERRRRELGLTDGEIRVLPDYGGGSKNDFIFGFLEGLRQAFKKQVLGDGLYPALVLDEAVQKVYDNLKLDYSVAKGVKSAGDEEAREAGKNLGYHHPL
jgi:hypothetical protein